MPIVTVDNKEITFPDTMTRDEIKVVLDEKFGKPKTEYNTALQGVRQVGQGLTFGFADEVGGALAALAGSMQTGESFSDAYQKIQEDLKAKREAFEGDNEALATGLELVGGSSDRGRWCFKSAWLQGYKKCANISERGSRSGCRCC